MKKFLSSLCARNNSFNTKPVSDRLELPNNDTTVQSYTRTEECISDSTFSKRSVSFGKTDQKETNQNPSRSVKGTSNVSERRDTKAQLAVSKYLEDAHYAAKVEEACACLEDQDNDFKKSKNRFTLSEKYAGITKSQMREFREAFRLFDKDGDGSITREELGRVMRSLGQFARAEELQEMLEELDTDGDGTVSFEEFLEMAWTAGATVDHMLSTKEEEKELRDAFRVFDKHNRGYITASDLRAVLHCLGEDLTEEEIEDMIKEVDVDGDGRIDFYEFVHALGEPGVDDSQDDEEDETYP